MIIQLEEAKLKLASMKDQVKEYGITIKIEELKKTAAEMDAQMEASDFWNDQAASTKHLQQLKVIKDKIDVYEKLKTLVNDTYDLVEMSIEEGDDSNTEELLGDVKHIEETIERLNIEVLLSGEYDKNNAILSFHPGAGGTEAQDWALMLYRMYTRWGEKNGFKVKLVDWLDGEEAGIKSATITIEGLNAYGYMKSESGVHRLVRVSPFDASGRRHTSFASVEVTPELDDTNDIEIRDEDIEVTTHKSSGAGGQHINKTESAVRILHKPTGIVVGCQTERSQLQNKETALRMLKSKLVEIKIRENLEKIDDIKGEKTNIEWGSQIRSYVFMPYTLVKDARTGYETGNIQAVMDGDLDGFINAYLRMYVKI
jgi:peptide chain release factor 2